MCHIVDMPKNTPMCQLSRKGRLRVRRWDFSHNEFHFNLLKWAKILKKVYWNLLNCNLSHFNRKNWTRCFLIVQNWMMNFSYQILKSNTIFGSNFREGFELRIRDWKSDFRLESFRFIFAKMWDKNRKTVYRCLTQKRNIWEEIHV